MRHQFNERPEVENRALARVGFASLPTLIANAGAHAGRRFVEFFTANIRNRNTRTAYAQAVREFFFWCDEKEIQLERIQPVHVAAYIEQLGEKKSKPTVKQHLAAVKMLFDYLVTGGVLPMNPASSVRGPKYVVKRGKTPVLQADEARQLLDAIDTSTIVGLRDRAIIAVMCYSFARVSATVNLKVEDYFQHGKHGRFRFLEKGSKVHEVPAHLKAEEYVDAYMEAAGIAADKKSPLFRSADKSRRMLTDRSMDRNDVLRMIKRRAAAAGVTNKIGCHTFRATGITNFLQNGGSVENAQAIAAHESPRTTKLYDRRNEQIELEDIQRIRI